MKTFLAIYMGSEKARKQSQWEQMDQEQRTKREQAGIQAWGDWMSTHQAAIVVAGAPLGKTQCISRDGISDMTNSMTGYVVVRAESHEAAAQMFEHHPHFTIFPGDSVEVMECLDMPGQ
jgi:hypothetical protein